MGINKLIRGAFAGVVLAVALAAPASADAGITVDPATGRFVTGGGEFYVEPTVAGNFATVQFECDAVAGPDASQTRVEPEGCVLYKGGQVVGSALGQSVTGGAAVAHGTATVSLAQPGAYSLCWRVSATYLLNEGQVLSNSGCGV